MAAIPPIPPSDPTVTSTPPPANTGSTSSPETDSTSTKKEDESAQMENEIVNAFVNCPYVQKNDLEEVVSDNPDKVMQGVQASEKIYKSGKKDQDKSNQDTQASIDAAKPDDPNPVKSTKSTGS